MRLSEISVRYPVTTLMVFLAMILLGLFSLTQLGLDLMPNIEIPVISVITTYRGAGPEEVESKITEVLEDRLSTVANLDSIESTSEEGLSIISLKFDWGINLDEASNDVRDRISLAEGFLPDEIEKPVVFKIDLSMIPILVLTVTADESYPILHDLIEDEIADPLKTIPGVATAMIRGGLEREIRVDIDRSRLEAYNLSIERIVSILKQENISIPGGHIKMGEKDYLIRTPEELEVDEIGKTVVATTKEGASVYLKDVATIEDSFRDKTREIKINRTEGLMVFIQKQYGANNVDVTKMVFKKLEILKRRLPKDVEIKVARDFADFIEGSLGNLRGALLFGGLLVILVLLFFLRSLKAGFIVACSIPTSLIVAFLMLYLGGYTLNLLSVSSLAIAMGMVVDCAIVVMDNISRHRERGQRSSEAAIFGASEMGKAITASTFTTIAVFVPIIFVGGVTGIMFKEMAYVICLTLLTSLFTALTLIPMLSSKFLKVQEGNKEGRTLSKLYLKSEGLLLSLDETYSKLLKWSLFHRKRVVLLGGSILIFSLAMFGLVGTRFMPEVDSNMFRIDIELPVGARFEETGKVVETIDEIVEREVPEKTVGFTFWGYEERGMSGFHRIMGREGTNIGFLGARLVPKEERKRLVQDIVKDLRAKLPKFPGAKLRFSTEDPLAGMLYAEGKPLMVEIYGYDLKVGDMLASEVAGILQDIRGVVDIEISRKVGKPELQIRVARDRASHLGLNISDIGNTIESMFSGEEATKYREKGKEYDIFVRLKENDRSRISDLENSFIATPYDKKVRLSNVATIVEESGPISIERKRQQRIIKVTANLQNRDLGSAVREAKKKFSKLVIPEGFFVQFGGEREEQEKAFKLMGLAMILGAILVYMVMASQFESFRDPFIILFSIPFAMVGVIWIHLIFGEIFTIDSFIGVIMLVGIVVNNGIVLISYINILRRRGIEIRDAIVQGGRSRLRPILITTMTTIFGLLPLVFSTGEGSEEWVALALTVIGGLAASTLVTLILIPTLYSIFEEHIKIKGSRRL